MTKIKASESFREKLGFLWTFQEKGLFVDLELDEKIVDEAKEALAKVVKRKFLNQLDDSPTFRYKFRDEKLVRNDCYFVAF